MKTVSNHVFRTFAAVISVFYVFTFIPSVYGDSYPQRLFDDAGLFSTEEYENLNALLLETEAYTGFYVSLVAADDIGNDKSDAGVAEYADSYYESQFGTNTDGIIFVINNDTMYDFISASGICISYFDDLRTANSHKKIKPFLTSNDFIGAVKEYCKQVEYYFNLGIPLNQYNEYEDNSISYYYEQKGGIASDLSDEEKLLAGAVIGFVISLIIIISVIASVKSRYGIRRAKNAADYLDRYSVSYSQKSDIFIRRYINKRRIDTDSHGGGGGNSSGRSTVRTSRSGGFHGGGGSRR